MLGRIPLFFNRNVATNGRFDALIVSAEIGYEKPSPEIFQAALSKLLCSKFFYWNIIQAHCSQAVTSLTTKCFSDLEIQSIIFAGGLQVIVDSSN
jgi:hypothetical protein